MPSPLFSLFIFDFDSFDLGGFRTRVRLFFESDGVSEFKSPEKSPVRGISRDSSSRIEFSSSLDTSAVDNSMSVELGPICAVEEPLSEGESGFILTLIIVLSTLSITAPSKSNIQILIDCNVHLKTQNSILYCVKLNKWRTNEIVQYFYKFGKNQFLEDDF